MKNLFNKDKKLTLSILIFVFGVTVLLFGISLVPSFFAAGIVPIGALASIVGAISLITRLIEWWDEN